MVKRAFFLMLLTSFVSCDYYRINPHKHNVGHIESSKIKDPDGFEVCFEEVQFHGMYARREVGFKHGKDSLRTYFMERYDHAGMTDNSGYITLRFLINCKGEIGRFEVRQVGTDYIAKEFHPSLVDQLLELTRSLEEWDAFTYDDSTYDSHTFLTFKIDNGELSEILP